METTAMRGGSRRGEIAGDRRDGLRAEEHRTGGRHGERGGARRQLRLRRLADRTNHPEPVGTRLLHVTRGAARVVEREDRHLPVALRERGGKAGEGAAGRVHEELERTLLADGGARALDLDGGTGLAAGEHPGGAEAAGGQDEEREEHTTHHLHPPILLRGAPRGGRHDSRRAPPGRVVRGRGRHHAQGRIFVGSGG
ncbi:MAG: hypothetical protein R2708_22120 [Vicinamibacterales bacterium]